ncbi:LPS export ABC transporter permease LptG [Haliea sp. E17]|uniref:LPS export ABC transporter permease LptG n=1 Tax=Haliea sp. E17 TaxID=3401576 RepID=UPI003AAAFA67
MILQRYLATRMVWGWLLALGVLAPIFGMIEFISELDRTQLDYDGWAVARYTLLSLPQQVVTLAPVIALLGSMAALSALYRSNELTVMSCTGFTPGHLLRAIAWPTLVLMLLLWVLMEFVAPRLHLLAEQQRHVLRYGNAVNLPSEGIWAVDGHRYTRLGRITRDGVPGDIDVLEFTPEGELLRAVHGRSARVLPRREWILRHVRIKELRDGVLVTRRQKELAVNNLWEQNELPTLSLPIETMSLSVLYGYGNFLADSGRPAGNQRGLFWQKFLMPFTVAAMVLLATPLSASSGSGRDRSVGIKMGIGALAGILFFLAAQIINALGQLLGLAPAVTASLPAAGVVLCALFLLRRMRW